MNTKCIIFDKDGTLFDFEAFWGKILISATEKILMHYGADIKLAEEIYALLGVENGVCNIDGTYCQGDAGATGMAVYQVLIANGINVDTARLADVANKAFLSSHTAGEYIPNCKDLKGLLNKLRNMGIILTIVTADSDVSTRMTLDKLGVSDCFDEIFVADGVHPGKPDPYYINVLMKKYSLNPEEVLMVGDTIKDMEFAQNAGVRAVGVAKSEKNHSILKPYAVTTVEDLDDIIEIL